jgi:hypothetical protein
MISFFEAVKKCFLQQHNKFSHLQNTQGQEMATWVVRLDASCSMGQHCSIPAQLSFGDVPSAAGR